MNVPTEKNTIKPVEELSPIVQHGSEGTADNTADIRQESLRLLGNTDRRFTASSLLFGGRVGMTVWTHVFHYNRLLLLLHTNVPHTNVTQ